MILQPGDVLRAETENGSVMLRRRDDVIELVVNGIFAMDSQEVASEVALADAVGPGPKRVLVGGLGLGYTAARLLDGGATRVDVVELAGPLIEWAGAGITEQLGRLAGDPRVHLHHADIADFVRDTAGPWDAICLDVDNGPTFLIHQENERIYHPEMLAEFRSRLAPGGVLLVWAEQPSPELWRALLDLDPESTQTIMPTFRGERTFNYALYACRG